jgi:hypothetical protein
VERRERESKTRYLPGLVLLLLGLELRTGLRELIGGLLQQFLQLGFAQSLQRELSFLRGRRKPRALRLLIKESSERERERERGHKHKEHMKRGDDADCRRNTHSGRFDLHRSGSRLAESYFRPRGEKERSPSKMMIQ